MKRYVWILLAAVSFDVCAAGGGGMLYEAQVDLSDTKSLQRGARTFMNYCLSCHSASYMRFSRLAADLQLSEDLVSGNLMFVTDKIGDVMQVAMKQADAEDWFGVAPPDLSVIARARGADWLTTYFLTFYQDPERPTGVNNLAFVDTAMPHVLWELQGIQRPINETSTDENGKSHEVITGFEIARKGLQDEQEYRRTVRDLVNFLVYLGEPAKLVRYKLGVWVIIFLVVLLALSYALKREYWKDVH